MRFRCLRALPETRCVEITECVDLPVLLPDGMNFIAGLMIFLIGLLQVAIIRLLRSRLPESLPATHPCSNQVSGLHGFLLPHCLDGIVGFRIAEASYLGGGGGGGEHFR